MKEDLLMLTLNGAVNQKLGKKGWKDQRKEERGINARICLSLLRCCHYGDEKCCQLKLIFMSLHNLHIAKPTSDYGDFFLLKCFSASFLQFEIIMGGVVCHTMLFSLYLAVQSRGDIAECSGSAD